MTMHDHTLPYPSDPVQTYATLRAGWPHAVWLDGEAGGRFSIMSADPRELLVSAGGRTRITPRAGAGRSSVADPLALLAERLGPQRAVAPPFAGGAIGYFGYELGRRLQGQRPVLADGPEMAVGIYDWALILDHQERRASLRGEPPAGLPAACRPAALQPV